MTENDILQCEAVGRYGSWGDMGRGVISRPTPKMSSIYKQESAMFIVHYPCLVPNKRIFLYCSLIYYLKYFTNLLFAQTGVT
jgi:hypothetical protein